LIYASDREVSLTAYLKRANVFGPQKNVMITVISSISWFFHDFGDKLNKEGGRVAQFSEEKEEMTE